MYCTSILYIFHQSRIILPSLSPPSIPHNTALGNPFDGGRHGLDFQVPGPTGGKESATVRLTYSTQKKKELIDSWPFSDKLAHKLIELQYETSSLVQYSTVVTAYGVQLLLLRESVTLRFSSPEWKAFSLTELGWKNCYEEKGIECHLLPTNLIYFSLNNLLRLLLIILTLHDSDDHDWKYTLIYRLQLRQRYKNYTCRYTLFLLNTFSPFAICFILEEGFFND